MPSDLLVHCPVLIYTLFPSQHTALVPSPIPEFETGPLHHTQVGHAASLHVQQAHKGLPWPPASHAC